MAHVTLSHTLDDLLWTIAVRQTHLWSRDGDPGATESVVRTRSVR